MLHQTIERIHVGKCYGDIPRGVFVVRGENVVLLGEIDAEKTEPKDIGLTEVSLEEILEKQVNKDFALFLTFLLARQCSRRRRRRQIGSE